MATLQDLMKASLGVLEEKLEARKCGSPRLRTRSAEEAKPRDSKAMMSPMRATTLQAPLVSDVALNG